MRRTTAIALAVTMLVSSSNLRSLAGKLAVSRRSTEGLPLLAILLVLIFAAALLLPSGAVAEDTHQS